ncbi:MAG: hypothetical protein D8M58_20485 [Calditrichaeota bacterium]|nr:MAG: hypothetical protein DWQ03_00815 [Calditrichota bacterium]MBL1207788.1 hypothetical protein [Calditrichota bacterium]NOG47622.1 hypothetical protein [Calditrichota bacterium]
MNTLFIKSVLISGNLWQIHLLILFTLFFGCSEKIAIERDIQSEANIIAWTKNEKPLTSSDIQQDNILNVLHVEHNVYGLIKQLNKKNRSNIEIEWFDADKKLIAKSESDWKYDEPFPDYFIASTGERIVEIYVDRRVKIFDSRQNEINRYNIQKNKQSAEANHHSTSSDLGLIFSSFQSSVGTRLILRTIENKILFEKSFKDWRARTVSISSNKKYFAASVYKQGSPIQFKSLILENTGEIIYESPVRTRRIIFEKQDRYVAFLDKNRLELVDLKGLKKLGDYSLKNEKDIIVAADFSNNGILLIQSAETVRSKKDQFNPWQYINNKLISLNMNAEMIAQIGFKDDWVIRPALWFDENKKQFFYGHNAGYRNIIVN